MKFLSKASGVLLAVLAGSGMAAATDVTIHLKGTEGMSRITASYECDAQGAKMGLPAGSFEIEYLNGAGNSLAILPIGGKSLIFSNVVSGSGARYAAGQYIWWEAAGRSISLSSDSIAGSMRTECHKSNAK